MTVRGIRSMRKGKRRLLIASAVGVVAVSALGMQPSSGDGGSPSSTSVPPPMAGAHMPAPSPDGTSSQGAPPPDGTGAAPASPSVGAEVPETYFGPFPSEIDRKLVGPVQLLRSGEMSADGMSITLPLYKGQLKDGRSVWYILTDTTDQANADGLGLNFSSKLSYGAAGKAARTGTLGKDTSLTFDSGTVDFSPERKLVPGAAPKAFPPSVAQPGSVGDADYSPLVRITNQPGTPIYNAPMVAFDAGIDELDSCDGNVDHSVLHDRVLKVCVAPPDNGGPTVTIALTPIFSFAKPAVYMSTEASDPMVAALDMGTFAPALGDVTPGRDDSAFSAVERLFVTANGPTGKENPQRQGLNSALTDGLPPLHVVGGLPTVALDYSPLWDLNLGEWTKEAIDKGYRARVIDEFQYLGLVRDGWITGPDGTPYGSSGIIVNCPIVARML